jgi:hypothetical protein
VRVQDTSDRAKVVALSKGAAQAVLDAHMELRQAFHHVWVFAGLEGSEPVVTEQTISDIP